jgi:hypothetical protein
MGGANGVMEIVAIAKGTRRGMSKLALAGLATLGVIAIGGLVAGWGASPAETVELSPADVVALRFPPDWNDDDADTTAATLPAIPSGAYALASAGDIETSLLFNPRPSFPQVQPKLDKAAAPQPVQPIAAPNAVEPKNEIKTQAKIDPKPAAVTIDPKPAPARVAAATPEPRPAAPRARKDSGALFNAAQLASIKSRLKLTPNQEEYWPPVESALRDIGWKAAHDGRTGSRASQVATIDPNSDEVQRLKSAAFPLIMSMNEDQKREVRMLAQVMGLQQVAASF